MTRNREVGLDAARGVALLSMFVAHFAPTGGPGKVLELSEHLTAFLFVLLIGCGAELGRRSPHRWRGSQVRAAALIVVGLLLMQLTTAIVVVLVWLGVMTLLAAWLSELRSPVLVVVGLVSAVLEPRLLTWSREWLLEEPRDPITQAAVEILLSGTSYRVMAFVLPACAGILLVRHATSDRSRLVAAGAGGVVGAVMFALDRAGAAEVVAYSGTLSEVLFNTAISILVAAAVWAVAPRVSYAGTLLAAMGVMALTIYTLQLLSNWAFYERGGVDDNQWSILLGSCAGAALLAVAWLPVRKRFGWRGPLEAPVDRVARGSKDTTGSRQARPT